MRILKAYASEVATQIGVGLGAALRHAVIWLNHIMKYVLKAAQAFATFMQTLFGKYKGGASGVNLDGALSDADDYADDLADSASSAASGLSDADEAAKKLKKDLAVLPFDELNQLAKDQESTTSSPGTGTGSSGGIGDLGIEDFGEGLFSDAVDNIKGKLGELSTFMDEWARLIKGYFNAENWSGLGHVLAWGINKGLDELYQILDPQEALNKINPFIDAFTETFNTFVNDIHWDTIGGIIGEGITIIAGAFDRLFDPETGIDFYNVGTKIGEMLNSTFREADWYSVGHAIANWFMSGWRVFKGFIDEFSVDDAVTALTEAFGGAIEAFEPEEIGAALGTFVTKAAEVITGFFSDKDKWENLGDKIGDGIKAFFDTLEGDKLADAANAVCDAIITAIGAALDDEDLRTEMGNDFIGFFTNLHWSTIGMGAAIIFAPKLLAGIITGIKTGIASKIALAVEGIKGMGIGTFITNALMWASPAMVGKIASDLWELIESKLKESRIGRTILDWDDAIFGKFETFLHETIPQKLGEFGQSIINTVKYIFSYEHTKEAWDEAVENFKEGGTNVGKGIIKGIEAAVSFILEPIQNFFDATIKTFCDIFGIESPAKETEFIGENIILGVVSGLEAKFQDLKDKIGEIPGILFEAAGDAFEWLKQKGSDAIEGIRQGWDEVKDSDLLSEIGEFGTNAFDSIGDVADAVKEKGSDLITGLREGWDDVKDGDFFSEMTALGSNVFEKIGDISASVKEKGSDIISGLRSGWDDVKDSKLLDEVSDLGRDVFSKIGNIAETVKQKGSDIIDGIKEGWDDVKDSHLFDTIEGFKDDVFDAIGDIFGKVKGKGEDIIDGMAKGYSRKIDSFLRTVGKLADRIKNKIGSLYDLGQDMIGDFADGLKSMVDFPSPHINWDWNGAEIQIGDWIWTLPTFSVDWYAKGGLFTRPTLAGFGEAGDEAALPLENQATMNRIARAIVDNSDGAFGLSEDQLASAVARGYVQAMMSNQGNERPLNVYATLYTEDNEVLARAVQKGNQSMDFRNNATPQFG